MSQLLSAQAAAEFVCVPLDRFLALVKRGYYPPPTGRDPEVPEWHRDELLAVLEAIDRKRLEQMMRDGLLAETEPAPSGKRIESSPLRRSITAGQLSVKLASLGARAYRRSPGDYRVFIPAGRRPEKVLAQIAATQSQPRFTLVDA